MDNKEINAFLALLKKVYEETSKSAEINEFDGIPTLVLAFDSHLFNGETAYRISLRRVSESVYACEILMYLYNGIKDEAFSSLNRLIGRINVNCSFGSYRLYENWGSVMYSHSALIDENLEIATAFEIVVKTLSVMENTVVNCNEYFSRLFDGEDVDSVLERLSEEV